MKRHLLSVLMLFIFANLYSQFCETPIGFGRNATGGAGGSNYVVTNLNNSGTGSLRSGLESTSTLNISFAVSGTIQMNSDIYVKSNKTIDGNGTYIRLRYNSLRIDNQSNIIIRNLHFDSDHLDHGGSGDAISIINGSTNIWVDHCSFEDWYDGTVDITVESDYVTVSWCYFKTHDKTILIGASDSHTSDAGKLRVTLHHNFFDGTNQRHPRSRFGKVHVYNNWYKNLGSYGIVSAADAQTHIENCRFENVSTPAQLSATSTYQGFITASGNQMVSSGTIPTTGGVFTPSSQYSYTPDVANTLMRDMLQQYAGYNTSINLSITASGSTMTAPLAKTYQWYKDGVSIGGATASSYTAPTCGSYSVRIYGDNSCYKELTYFNSIGQPAAPTITILGIPTICTGGFVTLRSNIAPSGFTYQWIRNGTDISGATSRDLVVTQQGNYRVKFTGACSSNSSAVTVVNHLGVPDCTGLCGGTAVIDCNNVCAGTAFLDFCGNCVGGNTGQTACSTDCNGDAGGTAFLDSCGTCSGGNSSHIANSDKDCNWDCFGSAIIDSCGVCSGGNSGHVANSGFDCSSVCFGTAVEDCNGVCDGLAVIDSCGDCLLPTDTNFNRGCAGCDGIPNSGLLLDTCGQCLLPADINFNNCSSTYIAFHENPLQLKLFPNPFTDETTVMFSLYRAEEVSIRMVNLLGESVFTLNRTFTTAGAHTFISPAKDLAPGMYLLTLKTANHSTTQKMLISR